MSKSQCIQKRDYLDALSQLVVYVKKDPPRDYSNGGFIYDGGRKFFIMSSMIVKKIGEIKKKMKKRKILFREWGNLHQAAGRKETFSS